MHVHDLNPKKTLATMIAFVLLLVIGFFTMHKPLLSYTLDMKQSLEVIKDESACFLPSELNTFLTQQSKDVVLIDIRDNFSFGQGHIEGAKNISAYDLSQPENIELLKNYQSNGITVVLYGNDQLQANGPWMLFRQVGFDNVKILLGGYTYYAAHANDLTATNGSTNCLQEIARYDYAKVASISEDDTTTSTSSTKVPVVIRRKKKETVAAGGC